MYPHIFLNKIFNLIQNKIYIVTTDAILKLNFNWCNMKFDPNENTLK